MLRFESLWPIVQYRSLFTLHWNSSYAWRFTGSGYLITQNTQHKRIFCTVFPRHKKDAGCGGGPNPPTLVRKRAMVAVSQVAVEGLPHDGLSLHTCIHSYCYHRTCHKYTHRDTMPYCQTCHTNIVLATPGTRARAPTLIFFTHILATPATPTSTQHFTYILATPATHRITYSHIFWRRLPRPCSLHPVLLICTVQFFDLWNCCGSERHPPKKSQTSFATHMVPGKRFCHHIFPKPRH